MLHNLLIFCQFSVINLCQTSAFQYGGTNVRVNAICPVSNSLFLYMKVNFDFFFFLFEI